MKAVLVAAGTAVALAAGASGWTAYAVRPPEVHTRTITRTVTVTRIAPPEIIHKTRWRTRTITVGSSADTGCIASLWSSYVALADGGPAGDPSLFQADCPGSTSTG